MMAEISIADWFKILASCFAVASTIGGLVWFVINQSIASSVETQKRYSMELSIAERERILESVEKKSATHIQMIMNIADKLNEIDNRYAVQYATLSNKSEETFRRLNELDTHIKNVDKKLNEVDKKIDILIARADQ